MERFVVLLIGPPGAGKGAFAQRFVKYMEEAGHGCTHLSTGDVLRRREFGDHPRADEMIRLLERGESVSDELMYEILEQRLNQPDIQPLCLLDGFPRTVAQAQWVFDHLRVKAVVHLDVPFDVAMRRVSGRRIHPASGRTYNIYDPRFKPRVDGHDDRTGEPLMMRPEDDPSRVGRRLELYQEQTVPILRALEDGSILAAERTPCIRLVSGQDLDSMVQNTVRFIGA